MKDELTEVIVRVVESRELGFAALVAAVLAATWMIVL